MNPIKEHLIGKTLANVHTNKSYHITGLLYEGSQAYIYLAMDEDLQTEVVVKTLKYNPQEIPGESPGEMIGRRREGARWEKSLLVSIHDVLSSAVPQVIDFIEQPSHNPWVLSQDKELHGQEPYLILEKISGANLTELQLPLPWKKVLSIGYNLALFLNLIHRNGYIHHSLTPENIILGEDGYNISILDFDSVAPMTGNLQRPANLPPQKMAFLPPEELLDTRCDLYSLGAILYFLLTSRHPGFQSIDFTCPSFISLPLEVQEIVRKCLARLENRYTTATVVATKIEKVLKIRKLPMVSYVESSKNFPMRRGTLLKNGAYRIVEGLSSGGQGRVYIAENTQMGNRVLIKTPYYGSILGELSENQRLDLVLESHDICQFEKDMLSQFHTISSMVPQPLDFFLDQSYEKTLATYLPTFRRKVPYLVLEYIRGYTLDVVEKLTGKETFQIGKQLCNMMELFHNQGFIYQDLKLANIIIDERGQNIYLIDLGSLCILDPKTGHPDEDMITYGTYTPGYRAPEWIGGPKACDKRTDIYTIGATLWALVSGESPASYFQSWERILNSRHRRGQIGEFTWEHCLCDAESPQLPFEKMELTPEEEAIGVGAVIQKALERKPVNRYKSVGEMKMALQGILDRLD